MEIKFKRLHPDAIIPTKATDGSACYDVYSVQELGVHHSAPFLVPTGIAVQVPKGYYMEIRPRSGLAMEGIIVPNSPGTIDSDYRGELKVLLWGPKCIVRIGKGSRIAQIQVQKCGPDLEFVEVEELPKTERGEGGFGSTGK